MLNFPSKDVQYTFDDLQTSECGNLYGCCIERALNISNAYGKFSFIVPVAITCSKRMANVITIFKREIRGNYTFQIMMTDLANYLR